MTTIVVLAMIFALLALRLYAVLGRRTGQEPRQLPATIDDAKVVQRAPAKPATDSRAPTQPGAESAVAIPAQAGLRALIAADRSFDVTQFVSGARSAYGMILEAFWKGDRETLHQFCDADVLAAFESAIDEREAAGHSLSNRLVRIDSALIDDVRVEGSTALISVRFSADIAAITRDKDGTIIGGSMDDAVTTQDIWTFSRDLRSRDPNWQLVETDEV
ncbi:Tim44/TimA family putative adaptor protein [Sphingobium sp. CR28]|uniref:Tim44/TimA family putative adaptor protein n=1 Tax=Sphingobium sp. CR28 TaxID=3400272 RepID=UPI003FEF87EC